MIGKRLPTPSLALGLGPSHVETPMPDQPLAYFITFTTYGTWLHGDERGSVDRGHNQFDSPWLEPDSSRFAAGRSRMAQAAYALDAARREVVRAAVVDDCRYRAWQRL